MKDRSRLSGFAKYSLFVLAYNVVVILWGVFLRASKSGDGCGQHWLTCHGEIIPSAPELKTVIEFSHRLTSGLAFLFVVALLIWAFRKFEKGSPVRKTALVSFIFIVTEALVGAGLVLTGNTAETLTATRPLWMAGHLINTFILLAFLALTCRFAAGGTRIVLTKNRNLTTVVAAGLFGIILIGVTGSVAALASMLFPSATLAAGLKADISGSSHLLVRLRVFHPIVSVIVGVFLFLAAGWIKKLAGGRPGAGFWSNAVSILVVAQIAFGGLTLVSGAPILMQLGHLFLADAIWVAFIMLGAASLSELPDIAASA